MIDVRFKMNSKRNKDFGTAGQSISEELGQKCGKWV
jgi:hypothetical protein